MRTTSNARGVAGQLTAYATWILGSQYRTHFFLILVLRDHSRIIRWDRGGAVVTEPILHSKGHVLDFLIWFNGATPQARGHDITVRAASQDEQHDARMEVKELVNATSLLSLSIPGTSQSSGLRRYIVEPPCPRPGAPAGRWTRTSIAYDVQRRRSVFIKDSWRVSLEGLTPEGQIYSELHDNSVPNVPFCSDAGDIGDDLYHSSRTHEFNDRYGSPSLSTYLVPHRHYRLVLDTIGQPLQTFRRSRHLVSAVYDALVGEFTVCYPFGNAI